MEIMMLAMSGVALIGAGVGVTIVMARRMPMAVLERAQHHGRFAGLGTGGHNGGTGRAVGGRIAGSALPVPSAA